MKLEGGGPFKLGPGQITDDSEMALCIFLGLSNDNLYYLTSFFSAK